MPTKDDPALGPVHDDIERVEKILTLLEDESDLATRADLAKELVRECSLLEDMNEHSIYPFLQGIGENEVVARLRASGDLLRKALEPVFDAVRHTVPLSVHASEPMFERRLDELCSIAKDHFAYENGLFAEMRLRLTPD